MFASGSRFYTPAVTVIHSDQQQCTYAAASARDAKKSQEGRILAAWSRPVEDTLQAPSYAQLKVSIFVWSSGFVGAQLRFGLVARYTNIEDPLLFGNN